MSLRCQPTQGCAQGAAEGLPQGTRGGPADGAVHAVGTFTASDSLQVHPEFSLAISGTSHRSGKFAGDDGTRLMYD